MPAAPQLRDIVFTFGLETLDDVFDREFCRPADQALLAFAADERVGELLVADPWRSFVLSAARRRPLRLVERTTVRDRPIVRVRPHRLRRVDPWRSESVARSYKEYGRLVGTALARARGEGRVADRSAVLVTCHPLIAAHCDAPWIERVVYYGRDDWATSELMRRWREVYRDAYSTIDRRGAAVFVVSEELATRVSPRAHVVPNGVNPEIWRPRQPTPTWISDLPRPRAVYTGTIDGRLEPALVESTSRCVGSLVMIGPHGDPSVVRWLRSMSNVHVFDSVGQQELAAAVQGCDLGIIPHRDLPDIRAMSPLKLYEYLAAGLPVIASDLPPIHGVEDARVRLSTPEDWESTLALVVATGPATEPARMRFIAEASWSRRMQPLLDASLGEAATP